MIAGHKGGGGGDGMEGGGGGAGTGRKGDAILCVNHTFSVCDLWDQPMIHLSSGVNQGSNKNINI